MFSIFIKKTKQQLIKSPNSKELFCCFFKKHVWVHLVEKLRFLMLKMQQVIQRQLWWASFSGFNRTWRVSSWTESSSGRNLFFHSSFLCNMWCENSTGVLFTQGMAKAERGVTELAADQWKGRSDGKKCYLSRVEGRKDTRYFCHCLCWT